MKLDSPQEVEFHFKEKVYIQVLIKNEISQRIEILRFMSVSMVSMIQSVQQSAFSKIFACSPNIE